MKFTEKDLNRFATANILKDDYQPFVNETERQQITKVDIFLDDSYINLRGNNIKQQENHIPFNKVMEWIHPDYQQDAKEHFKNLRSGKFDTYEFYLVIRPWQQSQEYRVVVITLFAEYNDQTQHLNQYTGGCIDVTNEVYERRYLLKLTHKTRFLEKQFKVALWSIDPDEMILHCDKIYQDDFYRTYSFGEFLNLVHDDYKELAKNVLQDMSKRCYNMSDTTLRVHHPDGTDHYFHCCNDRLFDKDGHIFRYLVYSVDITTQKQQEFKNKTFYEHLHKMMEEGGVRLFYYTPGTRRLHMEDPLADKRLANISIEEYMERVLEDDVSVLYDVFEHCDKQDLDRQDFFYRLKPFNDESFHRYRTITMPVFNEEGKLTMYGFIRMDITQDYNNQAIFNYAQNVGKIGAWTYDIINKQWSWTHEMYRIFDVPSNTDANKMMQESLIFIDEDERTDAYNELMYNISTKEDSLLTFHITTQKGERKHLELRMHVDHNHEEKPIFSYGTLMDITDRSKLLREKEESSNLMHAILKNLPSAVFIKDIDNDFRIVEANDIYANFFNKSLNEIEGHQLADYSDAPMTRAFGQSDREACQFTAANPMVEFFSVINKDGHKEYYQKAKFAQKTNGRNLLICTATNVTALQEARKTAEENDRLKSAFLANMSHEIRTPLNAIVGFSDLIANNASPEMNNQFVELIHSNSEQLLRLIDDILDHSKLEANVMKFSFSNFDVNELMKESFMNLKEKFDKKGLDLQVQELPAPFMVHQDYVRVAEILNNFLTNALKNTLQGTINVWMEQHLDRFKLCVKDTGKGIPPEKLKTIFNRFEKLDQFKEGTGLGLAICSGITDALGGTIGVESEEGKGSMFWVELPINGKIQAQH